MAKAAQQSGDDESIMGYFRPLLEANLKLLENRSKNDELYERWLEDHPQYREVPDKVKNGLSNLKSSMRKKMKLGKRRRRQQVEAATDGGAAPATRLPRGAAGQLERLEEQIDECLALARSLDREGLKTVLESLRGARNQVVVRLGR